jgi:seryl-tRNA synthetase
MSGLDINWFREDKGYKPDVIRDSLKKRYRDPKLVDEIIEKDQEWRKSKSIFYPSTVSA